MIGGKPIIGLAGGIGSGKSFVGKIFGEMGCVVISSDDHVREAYRRDDVKETLRSWWGETVFLSSGEINKSAIAAKVFADERERRRLEGLIHPLVKESRDAIMRARASDPKVAAFVWDVPLLFETGLDRECDVVVFVDSSAEARAERVQKQRGWDLGELSRREKAQWGLDKKRDISDYVISNTADAGFVRDQIRDVLSQILAKKD